MGGGWEGKHDQKRWGETYYQGRIQPSRSTPPANNIFRNLKKFSCLSGCLTRCEEQTLWKAGRREKCAGNDPFLPSCLPNLLCVKQPDMQERSYEPLPAEKAGGKRTDLAGTGGRWWGGNCKLQIGNWELQIADLRAPAWFCFGKKSSFEPSPTPAPSLLAFSTNAWNTPRRCLGKKRRSSTTKPNTNT